MKPSYLLSFVFAALSLSSIKSTTAHAAPNGITNAGIYNIVARHSGKCLDVFDHGLANGTHLQQWACTGEAHQNFRVVDKGDGTHELQNVNSGRCVDVAEASYNNGGRVHQWDCSGNHNQKVRLVPSVDGSFLLRFAHSNKCLDVSGPSSDNGAVVHQWDCVGQSNQDWIIRPSTSEQGTCANGFRSNWDKSCSPRTCGGASLGSRFIRSIEPATGLTGIVTKTFVCSTVRSNEGLDMNVFIEDNIYDPLTDPSQIEKSYPSRCSRDTAYIVYSMSPRSWGTAFDGTCLDPRTFNIPLDMSEFNWFY